MPKKGREVFKVALGLILVWYVLRSRMVDLKTLRTVLFAPSHLFITLALLVFTTVCCVERWRQLAKVQSFSFSFRTLFSLAMIGNFFNTFLPGALGGDLVKGWYIAGEEPEQKMKAVFTVALDRAVGFSVILLYASATLLFSTRWLHYHKELPWIAGALWCETAASLLAFALFFSPRTWEWRGIKKGILWVERWEKPRDLLHGLLAYRNALREIGNALLLSVISMLGLNFLFILLGSALHIQMTIAQYFFIVPLAITFSAIPLLPGGVGTGQVAFYTLFLWMRIPHPEQGGTLCTLYQIYSILFNCLGGFFYLRFKSRTSLSLAKVSELTLPTDEKEVSSKRRAAS